jgi:hypothetical protein
MGLYPSRSLYLTALHGIRSALHGIRWALPPIKTDRNIDLETIPIDTALELHRRSQGVVVKQLDH